MGKMEQNPTMAEILLADLIELAKGLLEIEKEPVNVQREFYKGLKTEYKKLSKDDQKAFRAILNTIIKEVSPERLPEFLPNPPGKGQGKRGDVKP